MSGIDEAALLVAHEAVRKFAAHSETEWRVEPDHYDVTHTAITAYLSATSTDMTAAAGRIAVLEEALRPFGELGELWLARMDGSEESPVPDRTQFYQLSSAGEDRVITAGDFRRARAARKGKAP